MQQEQQANLQVAGVVVEQVAGVVVEQPEAVIVVKKSTRKTEYEKADDIFELIIKAGKYTEQEFKEAFGTKVSKYSKYSNKPLEKKENPFVQFARELRAAPREPGLAKLTSQEVSLAWAAAKLDKNSKWYVSEKVASSTAYAELKPGDPIPDQEGFIMGEKKKKVKATGAAGVKILKGLLEQKDVKVLVDKDITKYKEAEEYEEEPESVEA
jgi:hypothetical protein